MKKSSAGPCSRQSLSAKDLGRLVDRWILPTPPSITPSGPHTFFDIAPLKYSSWDEYEKGVKGVLAGYKSAKFTVNDDAAIHPHGDLVWATATIKEEMTDEGGQSGDGKFPLDGRL